MQSDAEVNLSFHDEHGNFVIREVSTSADDFFADSECLSDRLGEQKGRLLRCKAWVESVSQHLNAIKKINNVDLGKNILSDDSESDSEKSDKGPKRHINVRSSEKDIHMKCEWKNCDYSINKVNEFHLHVSHHIPQLELRTRDDGEEVYVCLWSECYFETEDPQEIQRHVNYHACHTRLKAIGSHVIELWNLPKCTYGSETRNILPDLPDPHVCSWLSCNKVFNNIQVFFNHVALHMYSVPIKFKSEIPCPWSGCKLQLTNRHCMGRHIGTHTKNKAVACPTCGNMFATNTKFYDHCKRQIPIELHGYQCNHCYKYYPSKRILRDHMRRHVNHYKCCYCEMTCTTPAILSAHIRFKHLNARPFTCTSCGFAYRTKTDLRGHMMTHNPDPQYVCEEEDCNFACRTKRALTKHMFLEHFVGDEPVYCCHIAMCEKRFKKGASLTKHLQNIHGFTMPSGHSKFIYRREEDDCYRLQTLRYESLEVSQVEQKPVDLKTGNFVVRQQDGPNGTEIIVSAGESQESEECDEVMISIEDEKGNVVNCSAIKIGSQEIPEGATVIAQGE